MTKCAEAWSYSSDYWLFYQASHAQHASNYKLLSGGLVQEIMQNMRHSLVQRYILDTLTKQTLKWQYMTLIYT